MQNINYIRQTRGSYVFNFFACKLIQIFLKIQKIVLNKIYKLERGSQQIIKFQQLLVSDFDTQHKICNQYQQQTNKEKNNEWIGLSIYQCQSLPALRNQKQILIFQQQLIFLLLLILDDIQMEQIQHLNYLSYFCLFFVKIQNTASKFNKVRLVFFQKLIEKMAQKIKYFSEGLVFGRFILFRCSKANLCISCPRNQEFIQDKSSKNLYQGFQFYEGSHSNYSFKMLQILENNFILSQQENLNIYIYNDIKSLKSNLKGYLLLSSIINERTFQVSQKTSTLKLLSMILNLSPNLIYAKITIL
ncbi:transmembrane protein, putative (macronuclear) [Tetrahymena thermophila SB210]|uniref:Transmembrane protein, putative n=1 Tax=Tetrahymena thermophila (strain SB210) TaxID=312017 RepID=W7XCC3_TETTS|nr:transmembrane protein, putative [Tetrahymena thermophila SB210]EWS75082.1 transmembrane protein, putative [Tetrahymena thermophila SB210]|eukprot:XP_012652395.1 transmembrane protein, putative [Tetrahymena thermophila SB210]